ncbi:MAG TPA: GMP/IMP nucleotidase [Steroidobacteraceae bacterium]|nr:GMP/IMP nucleotidase [Steroidobacteraceae bacterium]
MAEISSTADAPRVIAEWSTIDTVLLDMDGTLLDLRFDNYFWQELVPARFAESRGMPLDAAHAELSPRFAAHQGTLAWYSTDFWSHELKLDIMGLKRAAREQIGWLPGAERFVSSMRAAGKQLLLVTNAHPDSLQIKHEHTGLGRYFNALVSSHQFGFPKEHPSFWTVLQREHPFAAHRTLFIDDSLPVLRAARGHGIAHVVAITHPDSSQAQRVCDEFAAVARLSDLLDERHSSK